MINRNGLTYVKAKSRAPSLRSMWKRRGHYRNGMQEDGRLWRRKVGALGYRYRVAINSPPFSTMKLATTSTPAPVFVFVKP